MSCLTTMMYLLHFFLCACYLVNDSLSLLLSILNYRSYNLIEWLGQLVMVVVRLNHHHHLNTWLQ